MTFFPEIKFSEIFLTVQIRFDKGIRFILQDRSDKTKLTLISTLKLKVIVCVKHRWR